MDFFHLNAKIISKSKGVSAVASSAYCTASKMKNERTGLTHDFSRKSDVIFSDTLLPANAPQEFKDRESLWNSVEQVEKNSNAQLARRFDLAIPNEYPCEEAIDLFKQIGQYFADQGMCFDGGIHWEKGNHHFDFLVTMRPFKEDGTWGAKEKKDYALDQAGNRIPLMDHRTGKQKTDSRNRKQWKRVTVDSTGWNTKEKLEEWRSTCCDIINLKNQELGLSADIDHRSYERQGREQIPMQHEGYVAKEMEERGLISERCTENREIRRINGFTETLKKLANDLLHKLIGEARNILERKGRYTTHFGDERTIRRDDVRSGGAGDRDCKAERRYSEIKTEQDATSSEISIDSITAQVSRIRSRLATVKKKRIEKQELDIVVVPQKSATLLPPKIFVDLESIPENTDRKSLEFKQASRMYRYHFLYNKTLRERPEPVSCDTPDRNLGRSR